jgi:hypothetical protein
MEGGSTSASRPKRVTAVVRGKVGDNVLVLSLSDNPFTTRAELLKTL